jgi:hypothetical protein
VHTRVTAAIAGCVFAIALAVWPAVAQPPATITVSGTAFHVDGRQEFLLGVSLFDSLGSTPPRDLDLDTLRQWGVRLVRVWAHWHEPIYQADGALTAQGRSRLLALTQRLRARGMILELALLRPGQLPGQGVAIFASAEARVRSVQAITTGLRDYRNVIFDLYNEHDHPGGPMSHADGRVLRDAVKAIDSARLVTISSTGGHLVSAASQVGPGEERNIREEAGTGPGEVAVDIVAPHLPQRGAENRRPRRPRARRVSRGGREGAPGGSGGVALSHRCRLQPEAETVSRRARSQRACRPFSVEVNRHAPRPQCAPASIDRTA